MHLQLLVLTSIFVTGILATPLTTHQANVGPNPQTKYVELYRENAFASGSYLIYYGTDSETPAERNNTKKCRASCTSKGTVACSTKNTTRSDTCNSLMQELKQDLRVSVPGSPHRVCYLGNGEVNQNCCISWTKPVPGLKKGDLYTVAYNS